MKNTPCIPLKGKTRQFMLFQWINIGRDKACLVSATANYINGLQGKDVYLCIYTVKTGKYLRRNKLRLYKP